MRSPPDGLSQQALSSPPRRVYKIQVYKIQPSAELLLDCSVSVPMGGIDVKILAQDPKFCRPKS